MKRKDVQAGQIFRYSNGTREATWFVATNPDDNYATPAPKNFWGQRWCKQSDNDPKAAYMNAEVELWGERQENEWGEVAP